MKYYRWPIAIISSCILAVLGATSAQTATSAQFAVTDYALTDNMVDPGGPTLGPDGNMWFTECTDSACDSSGIGMLNPSSGSVSNYPVTGDSGFGTENMTVGPDGALWFTQGGPNGYIGRITTAGAVSYPSPTINYPGDITVGPDGNLWFTTGGPPGEGSGGSIGVLSPSGTLLTTYSGPGIDIPASVTTGPDGNMWFTNWGNNTIGQINLSTSTVTTFSDPSVSQPIFIVTGPDGNLWFANNGNNSIGQITPSGVISNFTGDGISQPTDIISSGGALWFANQGDNSLGEITTAGVVSWFPEAGIINPTEIATGPDGGLWFVDGGAPNIGDMTQQPGGNPVSVTNPGGQSTYQYSKVSLQVKGSSANGSALSWSGVGLPSAQISSSSGMVSGQITAAPGKYPATVGALDNSGSGAVSNFTWTVKADVGSDVVNASSGTCLNNYAFLTTPGNPIENWKCFASGPNEMFSHPSNNELVVLGQCLTDPGTGGKGTAQVIEPCTGASNQTWTHKSNGEYVLKLNGMCLTDPASSTANGTPIKVYPCKNVKDQHWS